MFDSLSLRAPGSVEIADGHKKWQKAANLSDSDPRLHQKSPVFAGILGVRGSEFHRNLHLFGGSVNARLLIV
jgi:hypothetical protein